MRYNFYRDLFMTVMRPAKYLFAVLSAAFFCSCALTARRNAPALPARAAPAKKEAAVKLSPEDEKKVETLYYRAVGAYSNNDMGAARKYLDGIAELNPSYPPAAELRAKILKVSGQN